MSEKNSISIESKMPEEIYETIQDLYGDAVCPPVDHLPNCLVAYKFDQVVAIMFVSLISTTCIAQIESVLSNPNAHHKNKHDAISDLIEEAEVFAKANGKSVIRSFVEIPSLRKGLKARGYIEEPEQLYQFNKKI